MSRIWSMRCFLLAGALAASALMTETISAQGIPDDINEIFLDSPGSGDIDEYFEITGTNGAIPEDEEGNRYYFVQVECERGASGASAGHVDFVVQLTGTIASLRAWYDTSSDDLPGSPTGDYGAARMENSGGTFFLIEVPTGEPVPAVGQDWDSGNDGVLEGFDAQWVKLDQIAVVAEQDDVCIDPICYATTLTFYAGNDLANEDDCITVAGGSKINTNVGRGACRGTMPEIEYIGRCSDDGQVWFVAGVEENGSSDVFIVTAAGGAPQALKDDQTIPFATGGTISTPGALNSTCLSTSCAACTCP